MRIPRRLALAGALLGLSACLDGVEVDNRIYPCRQAVDCVEGYECHPSRWICVVAGSVESDAGPPDAAVTPDAGPEDASLSDGG